MILDKSIEMMKKCFNDYTFIYGERPVTAFEGVFNAYVHVPFCMSTCDHCPFYKELYRHVKKCGYLKALITEIDRTEMDGSIGNLHFGGGTPNLLTLDELGLIVDQFKKKCAVNTISIETLFSILSEPYLQGLRAMGIERIQVGFENSPHFFEILELCRENNVVAEVTLLAGDPSKRETRFIEDVHLLAEMRPAKITVQPLIQFAEAPDERIFELIELASDILLENNYQRLSLWSFGILQEIESEPDSSPEPNSITELSEPNPIIELSEPNPTEDIYFTPVLGFGPSAYSRFGDWQSVNPELDLYIYEQLYGKSRVIWRRFEPEVRDWQHLAKRFYNLEVATAEELPIKMNWYIRWLQLSGIIKNNHLTDKGIRYAHQMVHTMISNLPHPIQDTSFIDNLMIYEVEKSFAISYINQMEGVHDNPKTKGMELE